MHILPLTLPSIGLLHTPSNCTAHQLYLKYYNEGAKEEGWADEIYDRTEEVYFVGLMVMKGEVYRVIPSFIEREGYEVLRSGGG